MKKYLSILFALISFAAFAQPGSLKQSGYFTRVLDTATYQTQAATAHAQGYSDIYWNAQATTEHMDIWNGSSYTHVFDFNAGGSGSTPTLQQVLTAGSVLTGDQTITSGDRLDVTLTDGGSFGSGTTKIDIDAFGNLDLQYGAIELNGDPGSSGLYVSTGGWGTPVVNGINNGAVTTSPSQDAVFDALALKAPLASPTLTGTPTAPTAAPGTNTTQIATTAFVTTADNLKANEQVTHNIQTGSNYTLVLTDADTKSILMRSLAAQTVTVPPFSSVAFPEGTMIILTQDSTGGLSVVAGSGVSIETSAGNLVSRGQDSPMVLEKKNASNSWFLRNGTPAIIGEALTKVDDTNVTLTLGGTPSTALLEASSLTLGWTGILAAARGGTGADNTTQTYTPTLTNTANVSASTARQCTYFRVGNTVTVSGQLDIDPTTTLTLTTLGISLPVASAFTTAFQLGGAGSASDVADGSAAILSDATNDRATFQYVCTDVTNHTMTFTFTYQVL